MRAVAQRAQRLVPLRSSHAARPSYSHQCTECSLPQAQAARPTDPPRLTTRRMVPTTRGAPPHPRRAVTRTTHRVHQRDRADGRHDARVKERAKRASPLRGDEAARVREDVVA